MKADWWNLKYVNAIWVPFDLWLNIISKKNIMWTIYCFTLGSLISENRHHGNAEQISPLPASEYQGNIIILWDKNINILSAEW